VIYSVFDSSGNLVDAFGDRDEATRCVTRLSERLDHDEDAPFLMTQSDGSDDVMVEVVSY
jgi:hypothetical protein